MAELSSNWKKLQAKLKTESNPTTTPKRKSEAQLQQHSKRTRPNNLKETTQQIHAKASHRESSTRPMGNVQSSVLETEVKNGPTPSLALWAEDNDISAEAIAEAYDLGLKGPVMSITSANDKVNQGLIEALEIGKYVGIDCEMVGVGEGGHKSVLARLSMVDFHGRQIYDSYVKPRERVTDWRSAVSGISPKNMRFARDFEDVQRQAHKVLKDRVLVGHDIVHDLEVLMLSHPPRDIRDTAKYPGYRKYGNGRKPALRILAQQVLGVEIQSGPHSSIEDARVAMLLFRKQKSGFDVDHANRFAPKTSSTKGPRQNGKQDKSKRKT